MTQTCATNAESRATLPASARSRARPVAPKDRSADQSADQTRAAIVAALVATPTPDATDATRVVIWPGTARRRPRDATDATSQDTWPRTARTKSKVVSWKSRVFLACLFDFVYLILFTFFQSSVSKIPRLFSFENKTHLQTLDPKKTWVLGFSFGAEPRPKTQRDSEFNSIHFGITNKKNKNEFLRIKIFF